MHRIRKSISDGQNAPKNQNFKAKMATSCCDLTEKQITPSSNLRYHIDSLMIKTPSRVFKGLNKKSRLDLNIDIRSMETTTPNEAMDQNKEVKPINMKQV